MILLVYWNGKGLNYMNTIPMGCPISGNKFIMDLDSTVKRLKKKKSMPSTFEAITPRKCFCPRSVRRPQQIFTKTDALYPAVDMLLI
jgi:hypothetical protein